MTDTMLERAMNAGMPGGSQAWVWLFNCEGGMRPEEKHKDFFRRVLNAALANPVGEVVGESFDCADGRGWGPDVKFEVKTLPRGTKLYASM